MSTPTPAPVVSLVCDVIDALVRLARDAGIDPVFDGPAISGDIEYSYLVIGSDSVDPEDEWTSATTSQEWGALGAQTRNETGTVYGLAAGWNAEGEIKAARDAANANVQRLERALRATFMSAELGLVTKGLHWAGFQTSTIRVANRDRGALVYIPFGIQYKARLAGVAIS